MKKFRGATVAEALALARREFGDEALLLGTGKPANPRPGETIEVTVAAERPRPAGALQTPVRHVPANVDRTVDTSVIAPGVRDHAIAIGVTGDRKIAGGLTGPRASAVPGADGRTVVVAAPGDRAAVVSASADRGAGVRVEDRFSASGIAAFESAPAAPAGSESEQPGGTARYTLDAERFAEAGRWVRDQNRSGIPAREADAMRSRSALALSSSRGRKPAAAPARTDAMPRPAGGRRNDMPEEADRIAMAVSVPQIDAAFVSGRTAGAPSRGEAPTPAGPRNERLREDRMAMVMPPGRESGPMPSAGTDSSAVRAAKSGLSQGPLEMSYAAEAIDVTEPRSTWASGIESGFAMLSQRLERLADELRPEKGEPRGTGAVDLPGHDEIVARLRATGLDADLSESAAQAALSRMTSSAEPTEDLLLQALVESLSVVLSEEPAKTMQRPRIIALVGPTGTGKTTTAAKLAARSALTSSGESVLIAADDYRIGAVEQLAEYAELIGAPLETAQNAQGLASAIGRHTAADLIVVDTAGIAPSDATRMWELARLLEGAPRAELHLVLSATTRRRDLAESIARFRALAPLRIVFTRLDETTAYGELLSEAAASGCAISGFAMGQSVPDDFEAGTPARMAEIVVDAAWAGRRES